MVPVHCALVKPSRKRVRLVVHQAIIVSLVMMYIFGVAGYLFAYNDTKGNILLNFAASDKVILLGRVMCGFMVLFAFPLSLLPLFLVVLSSWYGSSP